MPSRLTCCSRFPIGRVAADVRILSPAKIFDVLTPTLALTHLPRGVRKRGTCPLVVSLLPQCGEYHASEASKPAWQGRLCAVEGFACNTPPPRGGITSRFHL